MDEKEVMAKALEIAITLTNATYADLKINDRKTVSVKDPLFATLRAVVMIIKSRGFVNDSEAIEIVGR